MALFLCCDIQKFCGLLQQSWTVEGFYNKISLSTHFMTIFNSFFHHFNSTIQLWSLGGVEKLKIALLSLNTSSKPLAVAFDW